MLSKFLVTWGRHKIKCSFYFFLCTKILIHFIKNHLNETSEFYKIDSLGLRLEMDINDAHFPLIFSKYSKTLILLLL